MPKPPPLPDSIAVVSITPGTAGLPLDAAGALEQLPPSPDSIKPNTPLRLRDALKIAFPHGGMTLSGLRRELKRKGLIEKMARKDFTSLEAIEKMRELCRADQADPGSGSNPRKST